VWGFGFWVWGFGFWVWGAGFRREAAHLIITMITWTRTSRLSIKNSLCGVWGHHRLAQPLVRLHHRLQNGGDRLSVFLLFCTTKRILVRDPSDRLRVGWLGVGWLRVGEV